MVNMELVKTRSSDGFETDGLLAFDPTLSAPRACIVHIHGRCGNFYQNRFIAVMSEFYVASGYALISMNNRGHDCIAEGYTDQGLTYVGGSLEDPDSSLLDIVAAMEFARTVFPYSPLVLQGHSMGCEKGYRLAEKTRDSSLVGLVLLSPADSLALQSEWNLMASKVPWESSEHSLVLSMRHYGVAGESGYRIPISKNSFDSTFKSETVSTFRKGLSGQVQRLDIPVLGVIGGADPLQRTSEREWREMAESWSSRATIRYIPGSGHQFQGDEISLCELIVEWMDGLQIESEESPEVHA